MGDAEAGFCEYQHTAAAPPGRLALYPSLIITSSLNQKTINSSLHTATFEALALLLGYVSDSLRPHGLQPARILCAWNFPGKKIGVSCHSLLQGIFPTQGLNSGLLNCRQILYHVSCQGSPAIEALINQSLKHILHKVIFQFLNFHLIYLCSPQFTPEILHLCFISLITLFQNLYPKFSLVLFRLIVKLLWFS